MGIDKLLKVMSDIQVRLEKKKRDGDLTAKEHELLTYVREKQDEGEEIKKVAKELNTTF